MAGNTGYMTKKRVNIALDEDLHTKAKVISVLKNITLNDFIEKAIEEAVKKDKPILDKLK
jgi:predicted HicB family RNase H-like nuclease